MFEYVFNVKVRTRKQCIQFVKRVKHIDQIIGYHFIIKIPLNISKLIQSSFTVSKMPYGCLIIFIKLDKYYKIINLYNQIIQLNNNKQKLRQNLVAKPNEQTGI